MYSQKYWHCRIPCKYAFKHHLYYLRTISLKGKVWIPALCSTKYLTISKCPSKQAALRGVELVLVVELTFAPLFTSSRTISRWPAGTWQCSPSPASGSPSPASTSPSLASPASAALQCTGTNLLQQHTRVGELPRWFPRQRWRCQPAHRYSCWQRNYLFYFKINNLLHRGATPVHQILHHLVVTIPAGEVKSGLDFETRRHGVSYFAWFDLHERTRGVAPLVLAATRRWTSSRGRWSRNTWNIGI